jgi:hypothetical protein
MEEICNAMRASLRRVSSTAVREHTPGAKARIFAEAVRPKAKALGYLEAKTLALRFSTRFHYA